MCGTWDDRSMFGTWHNWCASREMTEACSVREITEVCGHVRWPKHVRYVTELMCVTWDEWSTCSCAIHMSDIRTMVNWNYELRCFTLATQHHLGHHNLGGNDGRPSHTSTAATQTEIQVTRGRLGTLGTLIPVISATSHCLDKETQIRPVLSEITSKSCGSLRRWNTQNNIQTIPIQTWFVLCALCKVWFRNPVLEDEIATWHCSVAPYDQEPWLSCMQQGCCHGRYVPGG
jgi:hypothetical protein